MKIRNGFVTNSSSSSFICVLGEVTDKQLFEASGLGECYQGWQFKTNVRDWETPFWALGADWADVWIDTNELADEKEYFYWEEYGGAGDDDSAFSVLDSRGDWEHMDYDIGVSDFPEDEQRMFECATSENGLTLVDRGYGAGRNG